MIIINDNNNYKRWWLTQTSNRAMDINYEYHNITAVILPFNCTTRLVFSLNQLNRCNCVCLLFSIYLLRSVWAGWHTDVCLCLVCLSVCGVCACVLACSCCNRQASAAERRALIPLPSLIPSFVCLLRPLRPSTRCESALNHISVLA